MKNTLHKLFVLLDDYNVYRNQMRKEGNLDDTLEQVGIVCNYLHL